VSRVKISWPRPRWAAESNPRRFFCLPQIAMCFPMRSGANDRPQCPHGTKPTPPPSLGNSFIGSRSRDGAGS